MTKPLIQIDDIGTTREMTEEEHALFVERYANAEIPTVSPTLPDPE
jgi:hypothetical protein